MISFSNLIVNVKNNQVLLQGDDMGGFLRSITLLSKFWIYRPIKAHSDQLFPSIYLIISAVIYSIFENIILAYLLYAATVIIAGAYGFYELLSLFNVDFKSRCVGLVFYLYNPAIASMFFTGELHIVTTYYTLPYILLLIITPFRKKVENKYVLYSLLTLFGLPNFHLGFLAQAGVVILFFSLTIIILGGSISLSNFKRNISISPLLKIILVISAVFLGLILKYYHMVIHDPFKLYITYSIENYKRHSLANIFEALSLRPLDLSYNYYFKGNQLYNVSFWITTTSLIILFTISALLIHSKFVRNKDYRIALSATLFSAVLSIVIGLGPNNPSPISKIFIYLFSNFHVINLLKMGHRYVLIKAFFDAILVSLVLNILLSIKKRKISKQKGKIRLVSNLFVLLILSSSILVSIGGFNKTVYIPNEWEDIINNIHFNKYSVVYYVPSYPYTTLLSKEPSDRDVGSLNYLATWLELKRNVVAYSNYYYSSYLQTILLNPEVSQIYPNILINSLRNLNVDYILVSKSVYPVTKVKAFREEAEIVYQFINNKKLQNNNSGNSILFKYVNTIHNSIIAKFKDPDMGVYSVNSFGIAYPSNYIELSYIINSSPQLPLTIGPKHINDIIIKNILESLYFKKYNINIYLFFTNNMIPSIYLTMINNKIELSQTHICLGILNDFFIPLCRTESSKVELTNLINNISHHASSPEAYSKDFLIFMPVYIPMKGKVYIKYDNLDYTVEGSSNNLKWLILGINTEKLLNYSKYNEDIIIASNHWFAIGPAYAVPYDEIIRAYNILSYLIKTHIIYPISIENSSLLNNLIIINSSIRGSINLVDIFAKTEKMLIDYRVASIKSITLIINNKLSSGYLNIVSSQHIREININLTTELYKGGYVISLGDTYSIIYYLKNNSQIMISLREMRNNTWIIIGVDSMYLKNNKSISTFISYSNNMLEIRTNNKLLFHIDNPITPLKQNIIHLGIYNGTKMNITNMQLFLNGFNLNLNKFRSQERYRKDFSRIEFSDNFNMNVRKIPADVEFLRYPFIFSLRLNENISKIFVVYEPYTRAWRMSNGMIAPGPFNSYMIIIADEDRYCSLNYLGFIYVDTYISVVIFLLGVLSLLLVRNINRWR